MMSERMQRGYQQREREAFGWRPAGLWVGDGCSSRHCGQVELTAAWAACWGVSQLTEVLQKGDPFCTASGCRAAPPGAAGISVGSGTADCTLPGPEEGHQAVGCSVLSLPCGVQAGTVAVCIWGRDVCGVVIAVLHWDGDKHPCWLMALAGSWRWGRPHFCALMWKLGGQACYSFPSRLRGSLFPHRAVSLPGANRAPSGLWLRHWVGAAAIRISSSLMWAVCL